MTLRQSRRAVALGLALSSCFLRLWIARLRGPLTPVRRALWLQSCCRATLASLGIRYRVVGTPAKHGLVVSNHLSYLDILIFSAAMPCVFVSKAEVREWPFFGWAARNGNTIFLDRTSRTSSAAVAAQMVEHLSGPVPVLLFPEGTSTDGSQVMRFHSTLFQPAIAAGVPVTAASVSYQTEQGMPESELCWYGDATFLSHLWKVLDAPGFSAEVHFTEEIDYPDRRSASIASHDRVTALRAQSMQARKLVTAS